MKLEEVIKRIPENERAAVVEEARKATSADDVEAIAKRYGLDVDAQAIYDGLSNSEVDEEDLRKVAGGCNFSGSCSCGAY